MNKKRRPLSEAEREDAERLRKVWKEKSSSLNLTQLKASQQFGFANQSAISQYLNARIPLNIETAAKFAKVLHVGLDEISPRFAQALTPAPLADCPIIAAVPNGRVIEPSKRVTETIGECRWCVVDDGVKKLSEGVFMVTDGEQEMKVIRVEKVPGGFMVHGLAAKPVHLPVEASSLVTVHSQILYKITKV